ncbi:multidrug resistance protein homolog 49-like [Phlebotomus argentipes]|uniref:multidrug resistance protein homolog 49-like n=1 Tax=Phlebotomus argentipes TaxID=94469 RepID=UPI002892CEEE|nr:multidrug resistance protein homolog 49-like [Phlebotomus argentipes]
MKKPVKSGVVKSLNLLNLFSDFANLFRFATPTEKCIIVIVLTLIFGVSVGIPLSILDYAEGTGMIVDRMNSNTTRTKVFLISFLGGGRYIENASYSERVSALSEDISASFYISCMIVIVMIPVISIGVYVMNFIALRQTMRIRRVFLRSILSQDMSWFDSKKNLDISTKITTNLNLIKDAIGEKLVTAVLLVSAFVFGVIISMALGWELTLIMGGSFAVINFTFSAFVGKTASHLTEKEIESYSEAGSIVEEVFNSIRTVVAFGGEDKESERYAKSLKKAEKSGVKKSFFSGLQSAIIWFFSFMGWAYGMCIGIHFMVQEFDLPLDMKVYNTITILSIVMCISHNSLLLTFIVPSLDAIATAKGACKAIYKLIDEKPGINPLSRVGMIVPNLGQSVKFEDIKFSYPSRKFTPVLKGVDFEVKTGQTVALVGQSGSGKSTCLQLLQRLYDPTEGSVSIDGVNIKDLNIGFLRSQIGVVGQEPVLFSATIAENIRFGCPEATQEQIEEAARIANCHSFVEKLPQGYETMLGENGAQLSGGQKQRIAIARAMVRNPKILLLDEATSALDTTSERIVQKALDKASEGRTTLVVSHRLSTIRNADKILVFDQGRIVERGNHDELVEIRGIYYKLWIASQDTEFTKTDDDKSKEETVFVNDTLFSEEDFQSSGPRRLSLYSLYLNSTNNTMHRILKLSLREWKLMLLGILGSLIMGITFPVSSVFYAGMLEAFELQNTEEIYSVVLRNTILFLVISIVIGLAALLQTFAFGKVGARIVSLLRNQSFSAAMRQEIAWFDNPKNSVGAFSARLSNDYADIQGATGSHLAGILQAAFSAIVGLCIGLYVYWKLAIIVALSLPLHLLVAIFDSKYSKSSIANERKAMENASKIAVEAISNVRTVASLGQEANILEKFNREIEVAEKEAKKSTRFRGFAFSLNICLNMFTYAASFMYAYRLITNGEVSFVDAMMVIEAILYGAWMTGIVLNNTPNVGLAISSAERIFKLLDRQPKIQDPLIPEEKSASLDNATFRYPTRPETQVLKGLSLQIPQGKTVALVGPSGCGKSTCIQLLLRFYDPESGRVKLDGTPISEFSLGRLRSYLGLVSQEPVLFDRTIAENIAYGDNSREVPMDEIIQAAKEAKIHSEFITKLPLGYFTTMGKKGSKMSGGQKQRIAIARALVRKPKILLLDEATSALDAESEKTVQSALDKASENRTCIVIAHRLSTIRNADLIYVLDRGQIAEMGNHHDLMDLNGLYAKLYQQSLFS